MAISRYNSPAQFNPLSKYVPIPVEYLSNTLNQAQASYDINKSAEQSFIEQIGKVKGREEDLPALRNISSAYESALENIASKVNRDYGSSNYRAELNKLAGNLRTDLAQGDLSVINNNYNTYQAYQKQLISEKDNYNPYLDTQFLNLAGKEMSPTGQSLYRGYKNSDGTYNTSSLGAISKAVNREEVADSIIKGIGSIGGTNIKFDKDAYGNDIILTEKGERVSADKIRNTFRPAIQNTEAYNQIIKEANYNQAIAQRQGRDFDRNAFVNQAVGQLENFVVNKYTRSSSDRSVDFHNIPEYQQDKTDSPIYTPTRNGAALTNPNVAGEISNATPGSDPGYLAFIAQESQAQGRKQRPLDELYKAYYGTTAPPVKVDQIKPQLDRVNKNSDSKFTKDEYIAAHNKGIKDLANVTLAGVQIQPQQAGVYQQLLNNSKASALYNVGGKQYTINQLAQEYNVKPEEIDVTPSLIHYDSVDPNLKGGNMEVTLHIKGKEYVPALTSLNDNFTAETAIISEIGQNSVYKGQDTYTENNPLPDDARDSDIYTITVPKKQYTAGKELPFETTVVIAPRDGRGPMRVPYSTFKEIYGSQAVQRLQKTINSNQTIAPKDLK